MNRTRKTYLILIVFLIKAAFALGQDIFYENLTMAAGLPSETIYDIYKSSNGYVWIASDQGLIRYNGRSFKTFVSPSNYSPAGSIIQEDNWGRIWYQSFDGYFFFVNEYDQLQLLELTDEPFYKPYAIRDSFLYRAVHDGVERVNIQNFQHELLCKQENVTYCHLLGESLFYGNDKVYCYTIPTGENRLVTQLDYAFNSLVSFSNKEKLLIADKSAGYSKVALVHANGKLEHLSWNLDETPQHVYLLKDEIWCFTQHGIYRFDYALHKIKAKPLLQGKSVSSFIRDSNGFLWVGSPNKGIYLIKDLESSQYQLEDDEYSSISKNGENIFAGTYTGKIWSYSPSLSPTLYYDTKENYHILFMDFERYTDWRFFTGNGFYVQQAKTKSTHRFYQSLKSIAAFSDTQVYIAGTGFVSLLSLENGSLSERLLLKNIRVRSCTVDSFTRHLYVASNIGLMELDSNGNITEIRNKGKAIFLRKVAYVQGILYGITNSGKIFFKKENRMGIYPERYHFTGLKVEKGKVFFNDNNAVFTIKNERLIKLTSIGNMNRMIDFEVMDGNLFALTSKKIIKTPLFKKNGNNETPKIILQQAALNGERIPFNGYDTPYDKNAFSLQFDVLNFDYLNEYSFYYILNDETYALDPNTSSLYLPELKHGSYTLFFKIINKNTGSLVFETEPIDFHVKPPFWKTTWFFLLLFLVITLFFSVIYTYQIKKIKKRDEETILRLTLENNLKDSRLQLIKSQMNPHFFFNAINTIQSYIFTNETKEASLYLSKFSKLTRRILEFSDVNSISLSQEIEALRLYLELQQMRFKDLSFTVTHQISDTEHIKIPTMLFQPYVENAILHGLSHSTREKKLHIGFEMDAGFLYCVIEDNGIGRIKSAEINGLNKNKPTSFATKANMERIQLLNKDRYQIEIEYEDLYDSNQESEGTRVRIKINVS